MTNKVKLYEFEFQIQNSITEIMKDYPDIQPLEVFNTLQAVSATALTDLMNKKKGTMVGNYACPKNK